MADEPGGWELKRALEQHRADMRESFAQLYARMDDFAKNAVTSREHQADMGRVNDRLTELAKDIEAERADRRVAISDEQKARKDSLAELQQSLARTASWLRWIAAGLVMPIVAVIVAWLLSRSG
jgi:ABC-type phosphate transport system auxiliary subunit